MQIHNDKRCTIFFGDKSHSFNPQAYRVFDSAGLCAQQPFVECANRLCLETMLFLYQVHGTDGVIVDSHEQARSTRAFENNGDFLITNKPNIGLCIVTADCVPLVFYDPVKNVVAIAHAGWRGSVAGIGPVVVQRMMTTFDSKAQDIRVFIGPSAGVCCYRVGDEVEKRLSKYDWAQDVMRGNNFDVALFNKLLLERAGLLPENIKTAFNICTICDLGYCSVRREKGSSARQCTVVTLAG